MSVAEVWVDRHRQSGQPCVYGTRIPTRTIAGLVPDFGVEGVLKFYPSLTVEQVEAAVWYEHVYGGSKCARCGAPIRHDTKDPYNGAMRVCDECAVDLGEDLNQ